MGIEKKFPNLQLRFAGGIYSALDTCASQMENFRQPNVGMPWHQHSHLSNLSWNREGELTKNEYEDGEHLDIWSNKDTHAAPSPVFSLSQAQVPSTAMPHTTTAKPSSSCKAHFDEITKHSSHRVPRVQTASLTMPTRAGIKNRIHLSAVVRTKVRTERQLTVQLPPLLNQCPKKSGLVVPPKLGRLN